MDQGWGRASEGPELVFVKMLASHGDFERQGVGMGGGGSAVEVSS